MKLAASTPFLVLTLALALPARAQHHPGQHPPPAPPAAPAAPSSQAAQVAALEDALAQVDAAHQELSTMPAKPAVVEAIQRLKRARAALVEGLRLARATPAPAPVTVIVQAPPPRPPAPAEVPDRKPLPRGPLPMADAEFKALLVQLEGVAFGHDRVKLLKDAAKHHHFAVEQVREVVKRFDFGGEKVEAAATLYPRVLDKADFYKVEADFTFESDREALRKKVEAWDKAGLPPETGR